MNSHINGSLKVLFVDDEAPIRKVVQNEIPRMGYELTVCEDGEAAMKTLETSRFDVAILDLRMPGLSGWDVMSHIRKVSPETDVIISTGHGNMDVVIEALRKGAFDFLQKPWKLTQIHQCLKRVVEKRTMLNKMVSLERRLVSAEGGTNIIGETPEMVRVKRMIETVAPTDSTVLVQGETGTGKELIARRIHELSKRFNMPFVPVNCGAIAENLVESEFFGHKKGAFTGADTHRKGLFEVANGGTLFLDELGELDKSMQVKLLRFLESGEIRRVGDNEAFRVDVRIVCATNRHLDQMVQDGTFREDLFFRVNTFEIHLPSLRERKGDIPSLALTLIARHLEKPEVPATIISPEALRLLQEYPWSGNIRELSNALEHATILAKGDVITVDHLPGHISRRVVQNSLLNATQSTEFTSLANHQKTLREIEMEAIYRVLNKNKGDKPRTALELGIALKTLYNKLNLYEAQTQAG